MSRYRLGEREVTGSRTVFSFPFAESPLLRDGKGDNAEGFLAASA